MGLGHLLATLAKQDSKQVRFLLFERMMSLPTAQGLSKGLNPSSQQIFVQ